MLNSLKIYRSTFFKKHEKMKNLYFMSKEEIHLCTAQRDGDWVTFRCPECRDYVRRMNVRTGEITPSKSRTTHRHSGLHIPVGMQPEMYNPN
jgi:hypothetical protein